MAGESTDHKMLRRQNFVQDEASYLPGVSDARRVTKILPAEQNVRRPQKKAVRNLPVNITGSTSRKQRHVRGRCSLAAAAIIVTLFSVLVVLLDPGTSTVSLPSFIDNLDAPNLMLRKFEEIKKHLQSLNFDTTVLWPWGSLQNDADGLAGISAQSHRGELLDYADDSRGSRISSGMTSLTFRSKDGYIMRLIRGAAESMFASDYIISHSPSSTISSATSTDTCWAFSGSHGTVGLQLPHRVRIASASIQSTTSRRLENHVGLAQSFRLWGMVPREEYEHLPASCVSTSEYGEFHKRFASSLFVPLLLSTGNDMDIDGMVTSDRAVSISCSVPLATIAFEIWGRPDSSFTCVNRVHLLARPN